MSTTQGTEWHTDADLYFYGTIQHIFKTTTTQKPDLNAVNEDGSITPLTPANLLWYCVEGSRNDWIHLNTLSDVIKNQCGSNVLLGLWTLCNHIIKKMNDNTYEPKGLDIDYGIIYNATISRIQYQESQQDLQKMSIIATQVNDILA